MASTQVSRDEQVEHIGATPHPTRNLVIGIGVLALAVAMGLFYWRSGVSDNAAGVQLGEFRQLMAERCKDEQFKGPPSPGLAELYADSSRMQAVVGAQLRLLRDGTADCDKVKRALQGVDYPVR